MSSKSPCCRSLGAPIDPRAVAAIKEWLESLTGAPQTIVGPKCSTVGNGS